MMSPEEHQYNVIKSRKIFFILNVVKLFIFLLFETFHQTYSATIPCGPLQAQDKWEVWKFYSLEIFWCIYFVIFLKVCV